MWEAVACLGAGVMAAGLAEGLVLRHRLQSIPHRVLVGGVRGKSTLVRLIHAGLLADGRVAWGRITGDAPIVLHADGREERRHRSAPAHIRELRDLVFRKDIPKLDALVIENMAIDPALQGVVASKLVRPTLQVLASDAPDHLDVLPMDAAGRATALLGALDPRVPIVIQGTAANAVLIDQARARFRGAIVTDATSSKDDLYSHEATLLATARAALEHLGVSEATRAQIRHSLTGGPRVYALGEGRRVVDLLSTNDVASTGALLDEWRARDNVPACAVVLVFCHRLDRPHRLASFRPLLAMYPTIITGDRPQASLMKETGAEFVSTADIRERARAAVVALIGNAAGIGEQLREALILEEQAALRREGRAAC